MATMYQTIDISSHDPDELFEEMRAAMTNEKIAGQKNIRVSREFLERGGAPLSLVFRGAATALVEAHREMASHGPHVPALALAASREELRVLRRLGPAMELDLEEAARDHRAPPAELLHTYTGPEDLRDMATGYAKSADLLEEARRRGLGAHYDLDGHSVHITVAGPRPDLQRLAVWADKELNRTVDIDDAPDN